MSVNQIKRMRVESSTWRFASQEGSLPWNWNRYVFILMCILLTILPAFGGTIWVKTNADGPPAWNSTVTFREALMFANGTRVPSADERKQSITGAVGAGIIDTINIDNSLAGQTIALAAAAGPLPPLTDSNDIIDANTFTVIDGSALIATSTTAFDIPSNGHTISGLTLKGFTGIAVRITGAGNTIHGMHVRSRATTGIAISGSNARGNTISNCVIARSRAFGIFLSQGAKGNTLTNVFVYDGEGDGVVIRGSGTEDNSLMASSIGIKEPQASRAAGKNGGYGVVIYDGAKNNRLGNINKLSERTFISNNELGGVLIKDNGTDDNILHSLWLGYDEKDANGVGNGDSGGIVVEGGAKNNTIGWPGWDPYVVLSGHKGDCIVIKGVGTDGNFVQRTFLGGMNPKVWGIKMRNRGHGIVVSDGASGTILGGTESLTQIEADYLGQAPDQRHAIYISGNNPETPVSNTRVRYFHLGRERLIESGPHVTGDMIRITGNVDTVEVGYPGHENTINGAAGYGIAIDGPDVNNVTVHRVVPGDWWLDPAPNEKGGILIANGARNITLSEPGPDHRSCILGNGGPGIHIDASNDPPRNVRIKNCWIGLVSYEGHEMPEPIQYSPNKGPGIYVQGPSEGSGPAELDLIIGSKDDPNSGNVIVANEGNGITLENVKGVKIYGNKIGTSPDGKVAHGNEEDGILVKGCSDIEIGAETPGFAGNLISGNTKAGIRFTRESHDISVHQNRIGTDVEGKSPLANTEAGIVVEAPGPPSGETLIIGGKSRLANNVGAALQAGNVISGNDGPGVRISADGAAAGEIQGVRLHGNLIGVGLDGETRIENKDHGAHIKGATVHDITLGDVNDPLLRNVISGNKENGVLIEEEASRVKLFKNRIGTAADPNKEVPNDANGVWLRGGANNNMVQENTIRFNKGNGIRVNDESTQANTFSKNSIHRNWKKGIAVLDKAQMGIEPPVIDRLDDPCKPAGHLAAKAQAKWGDVEIFVDPLPANNEDGYFGQGREYVHPSIKLTGSEDFNVPLPLPHRGIATATFTDIAGNTSEFSPFMQGLVIQVVSTQENLLVANKPTVVRIFADTGPGGGTRGVTGELNVEGHAKIAAMAPGQFTMRPLQGYRGLTAQRKQGLNSLNFLVKTPPSGKQVMKVTLSDAGGGRERGKLDMGEFEFRIIDSFHIAFCRVGSPAQGAGGGPPVPPLQWPLYPDIAEAVRYFSSVFPFDPSKFMARVHFLPSFRIAPPPHSDPRQFNLVKYVDQLRRNFRLPGGSSPKYAAAVISDLTRFEPAGPNGVTLGFTYPYDFPQVVAMLSREPNSPLVHNGPTLIHEIGHTPPYNLGDTYAGGDPCAALNPIDPDPLKHDPNGNFVFEEHQAFAPLKNMSVFGLDGPVFSEPGQVVYDFMGSTSPAWADPVTYEVLFNAEAPVAAAAALIQGFPALIVSGSVTESDVVTLLPVQHSLLGSDEVGLSSKGSVYTVELQDFGGGILDSRTFGGRFRRSDSWVDPLTGQSSRSYRSVAEVPFLVVLYQHAAAARIVVRTGATILAVLEKSTSAPSVTLTGPHGPGHLPAGSVDVAWSASDPDPGDNDRLIFDVLYTPDGNMVLPLAVNLAVASPNSVTIATDELPAGPSPRFIVRASDGWNLGEDMSDPPVYVPDKAPIVEIAEPDSGDVLTEDMPVSLLVSAYDLEDEFLLGDSIVWTLDGDPCSFAIGMNPVVSFTAGTHTLQVAATDSNNHTVQDEVTFRVRPFGIVDLGHFAAFANEWRSAAPDSADLDCSGRVDGNDLFVFSRAWLGPCPFNWPLTGQDGTSGAAGLIIDEFDSNLPSLTVEHTGDFPIHNGTTITGQMLGDEFDVIINLLNAGENDTAELSIEGGRLSYQQDSTTTAKVIMHWDGVDGSATEVRASTGLGGIDITGEGAQDGIEVKIMNNSIPIKMSLILFTDEFNSLEMTQIIPGISRATVVRFPFSDYAINGDDADLTDIRVVLVLLGAGEGMTGAINLTIDYMRTYSRQACEIAHF